MNEKKYQKIMQERESNFQSKSTINDNYNKSTNKYIISNNYLLSRPISTEFERVSWNYKDRYTEKRTIFSDILITDKAVYLATDHRMHYWCQNFKEAAFVHGKPVAGLRSVGPIRHMGYLPDISLNPFFYMKDWVKKLRDDLGLHKTSSGKPIKFYIYLRPYEMYELTALTGKADLCRLENPSSLDSAYTLKTSPNITFSQLTFVSGKIDLQKPIINKDGNFEIHFELLKGLRVDGKDIDYIRKYYTSKDYVRLGNDSREKTCFQRIERIEEKLKPIFTQSEMKEIQDKLWNYREIKDAIPNAKEKLSKVTHEELRDIVISEFPHFLVEASYNGISAGRLDDYLKLMKIE